MVSVAALVPFSFARPFLALLRTRIPNCDHPDNMNWARSLGSKSNFYPYIFMLPCLGDVCFAFVTSWQSFVLGSFTPRDMPHPFKPLNNNNREGHGGCVKEKKSSQQKSPYLGPHGQDRLQCNTIRGGPISTPTTSDWIAQMNNS